MQSPVWNSRRTPPTFQQPPCFSFRHFTFSIFDDGYKRNLHYFSCLHVHPWVLSLNTLAQVRLKGIGLVFQSLNLIDALSARENVEYVLLLQGIGSKIRRKRSTAILQSMGLEELMDRNIHQMSGGHRQRIAVAWAVVAEPQLILADEPTANLDSENGESLIRLMEQFNRSKVLRL